MIKWIFLYLLFMSQAWTHSDSHRIPKGFNFKSGQAVFVDFQTADYFITYDFKEEKALVRADIEFLMLEDGYPVFDSVTDPSSVVLDGELVSADLQETPSRETKVRVINKFSSQGTHRLSIEIPLTTLVEFESAGVRSAFWTSDLSERNFLERYLPASFEYDQVKMNFTISFDGKNPKQKIYTNGFLAQVNSNEFTVSFPDYFNSSSVYFHTVPESKFVEKTNSFYSIDGREIPVTIYVSKSFFGGEASTLKKLEDEALKVFNELEKDYGPWPHQVLVIYNAGSGGMEYCGATITEFRALGHEMFHSYFARGVMPANGNAGWMDEALASWRDKGYLQLDTLSGVSQMSSHPYYTRTTDRLAYSFGEKFMRLLDFKFQSSGGLKPFLRHMIANRLFDPLNIQDYIEEMDSFFGTSVSEDFKKYTFGQSTAFDFSFNEESEFHSKMSLKELSEIL